MKRIIPIAILLIAAVLASGCTSGQAAPPASQGDTLYEQAESAFAQDSYHAAMDLYGKAYDQYKTEGNTPAAQDALKKASVSARMIIEFPSTVRRSLLSSMKHSRAYPLNEKQGSFPATRASA